jgi:hypothetical protein
MNKIWTYIIGKQLTDEELNILQQKGNDFVRGWTAHEQKLSATFSIYKERIIIVQVNEAINNASGCSIDKLLKFIKENELEFNSELLNRLLVAYEKDGEIQVTSSSKIKELLEKEILSHETLIYNTSVSNENELQNWLQPLKNTWLNKYLAVK